MYVLSLSVCARSAIYGMHVLSPSACVSFRLSAFLQEDAGKLLEEKLANEAANEAADDAAGESQNQLKIDELEQKLSEVSCNSLHVLELLSHLLFQLGSVVPSLALSRSVLV